MCIRDRFYNDRSPIAKGLLVTLISTGCDMIAHPFMTAQSRFVLQNRLPNFCLYRSIVHYFKKHIRRPKEFFQGVSGHLPKNLLLTFGFLNLFQNRPAESFMLANLISNTLGYPFYTVMRRLQCQSNLPGMIPVRYSGVFHGFKLILSEEGVRGLYRGYLAFAVVQSFSTLLMLTSTVNADMRYEAKFD
eukprot:TRINITY_DN3047_c0_g1_i23.p1 TRINITY_DN3047_c0_g1~~TRINITY_DN3047_c0_g1_i23.p1  ORF type:complete len:189 (-),score=17.79 TRINITY_DN3047_c0_g1_i23:26-592(-)